MATDEFLWKKVDEMKTKRPKAKQKTTTRTKSARKPAQQPRTVYSSNSDNSGHSADNTDSAPSTPTNAITSSKETVPPERSTTTGHAYGRTYARTTARDNRLLGQVPPRPINRQPERYAFNFWADQITRLKKLKQVLNVAKDADDRSEITLSDLVREAIDDYLDRQTGHIDRTEQTS